MKFNFPYLYTLAKMKEREKQKQKMKWIKITPDNIPNGTVIATDFEDNPAIGVIKIKNGRAFCEVPYKDHDNDCFYLEPATHFITMHQFEHEVGKVDE